MNNILILGGSSGIGEALVRLMAKDENQIVFTYFKNQERAKIIESETGAKAFFYDQAAESSVNDLIENVMTKNFNVLVNNAAEPYKRETLLELDVDHFFEYLVRGMRGALKICQAFASSAVKRNGSGKIVHVLSSVVMGLPPEKQSSYVALKYAWLGLMRAQAVEFRKLNIQVNAVSPSMTQTPFIKDLPERFVKMLELTLPMGRIATAEEVASVIHFLISPQASYIHGANIPVTGGQVY